MVAADRAMIHTKGRKPQTKTHWSNTMSKGTTEKPMTMFDALHAFLGPMHAHYGRLIDEWAHDAPVTIIFGSGGDDGGYKYKTTMGAIQDLDRAHQAAFEAREARAAKKAVGTLI